MRRSLVIVGLVLGLAVVFGLATSWLAPPTNDRPAPEPEREADLHRLDDHESGFYPYLNDDPTFANRSPVNVVVIGNLSEVLTALRERSPTQWNETVLEDANTTDREDAGGLNVTGTNIAWGQAKGTARYAYVHGGEGQWVRESAQLNDGDYFGYRHHLRLYEDPSADEDWVLLQVHSEHFDWFTLRHAVDGVQDAQSRLESDFMGEPYVERLYREHLGNDGASDSDGWATVIELALALPIGIAMIGTQQRRQGSAWRAARALARDLRDRLTLRHGGLAVAIVGIVLGVRWGGIVLEHHVDGLGVYAIGGLLYPVLALGVPVATFAIARGMERRVDAGLMAAAALGAGFIFDYAYLGVDVLPIDLLLHRVALVVAIGLVAAGSARRAARISRFNATLVTGSALWLGLLTATLLGWV
jgi:FlaG/FlaF family flagellin (archaellin)